MSVGNLKDQGNKGNNFPYQLRALQLASISKASNCTEYVVSQANIPGIEAVINNLLAANPDKYLVSKSVVYNADITEYVAFITLATI